MQRLKEAAQYALESALRLGARQVRVHAVSDASDAFTVRDQTLENLTQSGESSLFFHLFVDGRYGTCSTNSMEPAAIDRLLQQALAATRLLEEDPARHLPEKNLCFHSATAAKDTENDLQVADPRMETLTPQEKKDLVFSCAAEAYGKSPRLLSVSTDYADNDSREYLIDSQGLECESHNTFFSLSAECTVKAARQSRPSDWWCQGGIRVDSLTEGCGRLALEKALAKRNPKKLPSGAYPMVVENRYAATLLSPVIQAINGSALQQGNSFLINYLDKQFANKELTLWDCPLRKGTVGSRRFDSEGLATTERLVVENGILRTQYLSSYYAHKMGLAPTVEGPSVLRLQADPAYPGANEMIQAMGKGLYITGFNGGNCNGATGDFSYGVEGFWIENGQIAYPVNEMVLSGNMLTLWQRFAAAAADPLTYSAWQMPALLFESMDFAGL